MVGIVSTSIPSTSVAAVTELSDELRVCSTVEAVVESGTVITAVIITEPLALELGAARRGRGSARSVLGERDERKLSRHQHAGR